MAKVKRDILALKCTKCSNKNYTMFKTKHAEKIEQKKFCNVCKGHTMHKETKAN